MIQLIVEGQGEEAALPVLLRRLLPELGAYQVGLGKPVRSKRTQLVREDGFRNALRIAKTKPGATGILVLFDLDEECARDIIPNLNLWAQTEAPPLPCAIVMARREYEAWFLAAIDSLREKGGIAHDAAYPDNPEALRSPKAKIDEFMRPDRYRETADQPSLSQYMDFGQAYRASSFRKLVRELCRMLKLLGHSPVIPSHWENPA